MNQEERQQHYEDYIKTISATAVATGRREPYHLTDLKTHRYITPVQQKKEGVEKEKNPAGGD